MKRCLAVGLILLGVFSGCGIGDKVVQKATGGAKEDRKILYWRSPMDPSFVADRPGKDNMGMDLVPVFEGEDQPRPGVVNLTRGTVQKIGVRLGRVKREEIAREIRTVGIVTYDETRVAHIHTKVNGWIQKLDVNFTGQLVRQGDPLFSLYSPELVTTQQEYLLALKAVKYLSDSPVADISTGADSLLQSTRERLRLFDVTETHIQELEETGKPAISLELHSPIEGYVVSKDAQEGMYVTPAMNLYTIADLRVVWVEADVYEYEVPFVRLGQKALVRLAYDPGRRLSGKISYIYPYLDPKTRTVKVRMDFDNPGYELKPDMYVDAYLESQSVKAEVVPKEAVLRTGKRDVAFVSLGEGRFEARELHLGIETDRYFQVLSGLRLGEEVVLSAQFLLDSESNLQEAIFRMLESKKDEAAAGADSMETLENGGRKSGAGADH